MTVTTTPASRLFRQLCKHVRPVTSRCVISFLCLRLCQGKPLRRCTYGRRRSPRALAAALAKVVASARMRSHGGSLCVYFFVATTAQIGPSSTLPLPSPALPVCSEASIGTHACNGTAKVLCVWGEQNIFVYICCHWCLDWHVSEEGG